MILVYAQFNVTRDIIQNKINVYHAILIVLLVLIVKRIAQVVIKAINCVRLFVKII